MRAQTRFFHLSFSGFLSFALIFLSGCNAEMKEICSGKYDHSVTDVISQLELKMGPQTKGRQIAALKEAKTAGSAKGFAYKAGLALNEREDWESWSQSELKRMEAYLDWTTLHREEVPESEKTRRHLTNIANRLVAFHGYAHDGRVSQMVSTLRAVEEDRREIQSLVCGKR
jgi:hypothetical protein